MHKHMILLVASLFFPSLGFAHDTVQELGFMSGLSHPILGVDHLLAMICVGVLSAQLGGKAIWTVPTTFVLVMLAGGSMGMQGLPLFSVETGIAFSVLALGIAIAADRGLPPLFAMVFVGCFAIFHGHAHGTEMPHVSEPMLYVLGFILGTAGIHIAGVLIGTVSKNLNAGEKLLRYLGASVAGIGFSLIFL